MTVTEDLQTISAPSTGHVIDTAGMDRLVYEVRWSLSGAPSVLVFNPMGTNDVGITPDVWFDQFDAVGPNLTASGQQINGTLQANGRGIIIIRNPARYMAIDTYFTGASGTITLRAFGCSN